MAYTKQTWIDNETYMSAQRLNHMETGIKHARDFNVQDISVSDAVAGDFIYKDGDVWKKDNTAEQNLGTHIFDGTDAVCLGVIDCPAYLTIQDDEEESDIDYSLYVQPDGKLDFGVTDMVAAKVLSTSQLFVDFHPVNQKPKTYTDPMAAFFARPWVSGEMLLKIEKPLSADGVKVYRGTTLYAGEGMDHWGVLVVDINDDSDYKNANDWFKDDNGGLSDLTNGTTYYYKAFPYLGTVVNETQGQNETEAQAGITLHDYPFDDIKITGVTITGISGGVAVDMAGGNHCSLANQLVTPVKVGNGIVGSGAGVGNLNSAIDMTGKTLLMFVKTNGNDSGFIGYSGELYVRVYSVGNTLKAGSWGTEVTIASDASSGLWVEIYFSSKFTWHVYINGISIGDKTCGDASSICTISQIGYSKLYGGENVYQNGQMDAVRIFNGPLTAETRENLLQDGAGC